MLKRKLAIIDIGHGGNDAGACANGVKEKDANLITGLALAKKLRANGWTVVTTRDSDYAVSLSARVSIANQYGTDCIFISVHHNAGGGDRAEGIYSIHGGAGETLANSIILELFNRLDQQKKLYSKKGTDNKDYYYVIRNTKMPAVIVEVAFLDNTEDVKICDTPEEQSRNGEIIADGVIKWYGGNAISEPSLVTSSKPQPVSDSWGLALQKELNRQRYKDKNGNRLVEDGDPQTLTLSACPTLRKGAKGEITRLVQQKLIKLGFTCGSAGADGDFGTNTDTAIRLFQVRYGLSSDGVIGKNTWRKLLEV